MIGYSIIFVKSYLSLNSLTKIVNFRYKEILKIKYLNTFLSESKII
jgi:hypothetical protein